MQVAINTEVLTEVAGFFESGFQKDAVHRLHNVCSLDWSNRD